MSIIQAIILGLVQGLTEFIPVSSSGHLVIAHELFGINETGLAFDVALHIGTLMALVMFFYKDIIKLVTALFKHSQLTRLSWLIALATIPAVIAGLLLEDMAETTFRSVKLVSINLIVIGFIMIAAERWAKRQKPKTELAHTSTKQALAIGTAQALALVPGISRSGSTITAGILAGLDRVAATRFSFLLAIPITLGAIIKVVLQEETLQQMDNEKTIVLSGIIAALLSGLFAIRFLLRFLSRHSLEAFGYYRIVLGFFVLLLALIK